MAFHGNWRFRGNVRDKGGFNGLGRRNQPKKACTHFQRGRCTYGEMCKFSHEATMAADFKSSHATADDLDSRNEYFDWKRLLRSGIIGSGYSQMEHGEIVHFWKGALRILESDNRESHQLLAKDLVDDDLHGHDFIMASAEADNPEGLRRIPPYDEPFLRVITHTSLLDCLSVDSYVGTLYASFGGTNGDRAIRYLRSVCRNLMSEGKDTDENTPAISLDMIKVLLNALYQLLSRVRSARFHDDLPALLDLTGEVVSRLTKTCSKADLEGLESKIEVMHRLITRNSGVIVKPRLPEETRQKTESVLSSFPMDMQIPGGRHDNDFAEISQVRILPTHEEIVSSNQEYLPSTNFLQPHFLVDPVQRYIDSTFRLLRYDIFGPVKDVLRDLLEQNDLIRIPHLSLKDSGAHVYLGAQVQQIFINDRNEFEATLSFSIPPQLRQKTSKEQSKWWKDSNRLEEGSLVCFLTFQGTDKRLIFLEVTRKNASTDQAHNNKGSSSLVSDRFSPSITVTLAACLRQEVILLGQIYNEKLTGILVDFHGLVPATFVPILKSLQRIQLEGELVFQKWVLPGHRDDNIQRIPPPAYARKEGFIFPLTSITKLRADDGVALDPRTPNSIDMLKLQTQTSLDYGQCQGLIAALTREYALIQGPPGTGKSYVGVKLVQALLEVKQSAKLGPIIVICYTNHALDQFLKHLLDVDIHKIIRIGGRSQATELEGKNLRVVSKDIGKTRVESQTLGKTYSDLKSCMKCAGHALKPLHQSQKGLSWAAIENFMRRKWPKIHEQLTEPDSEGFTTLTNDRLLNWLGVKSIRAKDSQNDDEVNHIRLEELSRAANANIYSVSIPERRILAISWFKQMQENESASLFEALDRAAAFRETINAVHEEVNRRALIQADIIGITTTTLARHIDTLRRLGTKVIICEEAAEVMEAHVTSALMPGVEHFIQIGDHRQLRPQIQNHSLSLETPTGKKWQLDRSQFERRAVGEPGLEPAPIAQLNLQRRMRPEISQLIRSVYPNLEDHESVMALPNVMGMRDNLFWLDHRYNEDLRDDGSRVKSHSNQWEADMATALVRHLVRQGYYKSTDIALLTPYTGQLRKLRSSLSNYFEICLNERDIETLAGDGFDTSEDEITRSSSRKTMEKKTLLQTLRLATVDNFQGEEAKVIVVSLVRSNSKRKVGFLRTENRINVLLSRAQHGMYLIGNAETYLNVPMWADVHSQLTQMNAVGTELALCCPRHSDTLILCSEPQDFEIKSPEGGCSLPCTRRLEPCGHQCQAKCHSAVMHDGFGCAKPCARIRSTCGHNCPKLCGEDCGPCMTEIQGVELPCGHIKKTIFCHQMAKLKDIKCSVKVEKTVPNCGHTIQIDCFRDVTSAIFRCPEPCTDILSCGHNCNGCCGTCLLEVDHRTRITRHPKCTKKCDRPQSTCNHRCPKMCHNGEGCGSCEVKCEVRCSHSACDLSCGKACAPCIERCTWSCTHQGSCSMPCAAPCDRIPCNERCAKMLKCGHQCPSLCGEDCPINLCQECGDKGDTRVDLLEWRSYSEINLDETPIIVLACGHFFTSESVDGLVGLHEVYTKNEQGKFDGLRDISSSLASVIPSCPDCKQPIRQFVTKRYNRVINRAVMDEICRRFLTKGRTELEDLESRLNNIEDDLSSSRAMLLRALVSSQLYTRYLNCERLSKEALAFSRTMEAESQPMKRLRDAITIFQRSPEDKIASISVQMEAMNITAREIDNQISLGAWLIYIKSQEVMLSDMSRVIDSRGKSAISPLLVQTMSSQKLTRVLEECRELITQASKANFFRIVIMATISFAKIFQLDAWYRRNHLDETVVDLHLTEKDKFLQKDEVRIETPSELLATALKLCDELGNCPELQEQVHEMIRLHEGPRYEAVTLEELESIKTAMISGRGGIAAHSGHWYNCVNGHPFAIGECGMPMEQARCPECGAPIGGRNHTAVEGVTRALEME